MKTFENASVGDRVYSILHGCGVIICVNKKNSYPVEVEFTDSIGHWIDEVHVFTAAGFMDDRHLVPVLFKEKPQLTVINP